MSVSGNGEHLPVSNSAASNGHAQGSPLANASVHRIIKNSTQNLVGQGLLATFHLAVVFILARVLGKEGLGIYYTYFAIILVAELVIDSGMTTVLTRRLAQNPDSFRETVSNGAGFLTFLVLIVLGVFGAVGAMRASLVGSEPIIWAPPLAAGVACAALIVQRFCAGIFRAFERFTNENFAKVGQGAIFLAIVLVMLWRGWAGVATVLAAFAFSHLVSAVYLFTRLRRRWPDFGWAFHIPVLKSWMAESIPLGFGDVVRRLTWQMDTLLLAMLQPAAVVGIYSVAYRPLGPLNWLPRCILTALFPSFSRLAEQDRAGLDKAFSNSIRLLWIVSLPLAVAICLCAEPIIMILAGKDFLEAAIPMRMLIWIAVLSYLSLQFRFLFTAVGMQKNYARLVGAIFILEAVIECALIPHWGYMGAATGSMVGEVIFTVTGLWLCRRMGVGTLDFGAMTKSGLAALAMAATLWWPASHWSLLYLVPAVGVSTLVYLAICLLLGALRRDDLNHVVQAASGVLRRGGKRKKETAEPLIPVTVKTGEEGSVPCM